jgi:signal transduction histidine kinase
MLEAGHLHQAFSNFTAASKSLEAYYQKLQEEVHYLTGILEETNQQLFEALSQAEESKDFLNGILQGLEEAIIVLDPTERVIMLNRAAEDLLEHQAIEMIGRSFQHLDIIILEERTDTWLVTGKKKIQVILSRSLVQDSEGLVRGFVVLIKDISLIKELEIQRERNKRLISMGEMAAKLVHEIRNPLCSIELYASMLAGDLEQTVHADLAKGISLGIKSLNHVLTNMHYFAIPQKPLFAWVNFKKIFEDLLFMLRPLIEAKRIQLCRKLNGQTRLWGDGELIKQVLLNILLNAAEATPEEGTVEIALRKGNKGEMVVEIRDHGPGIPLEFMEKIFDPFFSLKEKGSGLGLSIAANIMQAHEGTIKVYNEVERGACFQLIFPSAGSREPATEAIKIEKNSYLVRQKKESANEAYPCS